jgi:hypothetical protein
VARRKGCGVVRAYLEQRADDGKNHNSKHGHDDAITPLASFPSYICQCLPYHDHAFIADTTGFTMMGAFGFAAARGAEGSWVDALRARVVGVRL